MLHMAIRFPNRDDHQTSKEDAMEPQKPLYLADFITGVFAALAMKGVSSLSLRGNRLDLAFERLSEEIKTEAARENLEPRFRLRVHPIHHDSSALQQALYEAAQRDLVSLDNPEFQRIRFKFSSREAPAYLEELPGSPQMYQILAGLLLRYYQESPGDPELQLLTAS